MGVLERYIELTQNPYGAATKPQPTEQRTVTEQPQIDGSNAIGSLAAMMGPTPAEREAAERRMQENKAKMAMWTGVFDGLRQLGNLYYTAKGAVPQKYDNPYPQVEQESQQQQQRYNDMANYRRQYATSLYNLRRQMDDDARRGKLADAQAKWYDTRGEMAQLKAENDRLKNEQAIATQKARQLQIEEKTRQMKELHPLQKKKLEATINKLGRGRGGGGRSGRGGGSGSKSDPFTELATLLNERPDEIGPILQQEGLGVYDESTKQFNFSKNATKGMATTAVRRATGRKNKYKHTQALGL